MGDSAMRRGMTLVEVLIVFVVIGMLMALLFPTLALMRESARRVECNNRMVQVSRAVQGMSERRNAYVGWRQKAWAADGNHDPVGWYLAAAPHLDAKDIHDNWLREPDSSKSRQDSKRPLWLCPSDDVKQRDAGPLISYVINAGRPDRASEVPPDKIANGIAMDLTAQGSKAVTPSYVSANDGQANTLMMSENLNATVWTDATAEWKTTVLWHDPDKPSHRINSTVPGTNEDLARPSSNHRGGVNAVMANGAPRWLSSDLDYDVYRRMLTTADQYAEP